MHRSRNAPRGGQSGPATSDSVDDGAPRSSTRGRGRRKEARLPSAVGHRHDHQDVRRAQRRHGPPPPANPAPVREGASARPDRRAGLRAGRGAARAPRLGVAAESAGVRAEHCARASPYRDQLGAPRPRGGRGARRRRLGRTDRASTPPRSPDAGHETPASSLIGRQASCAAQPRGDLQCGRRPSEHVDPARSGPRGLNGQHPRRGGCASRPPVPVPPVHHPTGRVRAGHGSTMRSRASTRPRRNRWPMRLWPSTGVSTSPRPRRWRRSSAAAWMRLGVLDHRHAVVARRPLDRVVAEPPSTTRTSAASVRSGTTSVEMRIETGVEWTRPRRASARPRSRCDVIGRPRRRRARCGSCGRRCGRRGRGSGGAGRRTRTAASRARRSRRRRSRTSPGPSR